MRPTQFAQSTGKLGYRVGGREVPVTREWPDVTVSCWRLNALERIFVLFTGRVWLRVKHPSAQPPAALQVRNPFRYGRKAVKKLGTD